jgi:hypothetical protein
MENQQGIEMTYESRLAKWERVRTAICALLILTVIFPECLSLLGVLPRFPEWLFTGLMGIFATSCGIHGFCKPLPSGPDAGDGDKRKRNLVALFFTIGGLFMLVLAVVRFLRITPPS